jgi:hypothetical protein
MRIWGRVTDRYGYKYWVEVTTSPNGDNSAVYLTWLAQVCKLNLGESPFFGDWGIPAHASVEQQIAPDFYLQRIQQRFSQYFISVIVTKLPVVGQPQTPTYQINVLLSSGARIVTLLPQVITDGMGRPVVDGYGDPLTTGYGQPIVSGRPGPVVVPT